MYNRHVIYGRYYIIIYHVIKQYYTYLAYYPYNKKLTIIFGSMDQ